MVVMTINEEQNIAHAVAGALGSADPAAAMSSLMAPGVTWGGPKKGEVRELEAREGGLIVGLRWPGAPTEEADRWHVLRVRDGRIVEIADFGLREDALSHLGRTA